MKKIIYILLVGAILWFFFLRNNAVRLPPGVLAPDSPQQENITYPQTFPFKDCIITPLAKFHIKAKVLSKRDYSKGRESEVSPVDLALGWGKMSDESVLDSIHISQSNRWYRYWWTDKPPIPESEIETHSANMHLIPKDQSVESVINRVRKGDIVELSGYLIRVDSKKGWYWVSSLSRTDTGSNACELVWVERFEIQKF